MQYRADLVVIGGGATGLGVMRDALLRGLRVILVERAKLGSGTSGHFHGLLHSGARYVFGDIESSKECIAENTIIKKIAPKAVLDSGGLFLAVTDEDLAESDTFVSQCRTAGIPVEEISVQKTLQQEPRITKSLKRAFAVPDAYVNGKILLQLLADDAKAHNGTILTHHEVIGFVKEGNTIVGVTVLNHHMNETITIACSHIINAAGIWSGQVGKMAGVTVPMVADRGVMVVTTEKLTTAVLNRCHKPASGDILVPTTHHSIMGTTSSPTTDLENTTPTQDEIDDMLRLGELLVPGMSTQAVFAAYAGIRPLYSVQSPEDGRSISRSYVLLDHTQEGLSNMISIVGGKLTIFRLMAEKAVDVVCKKLGREVVCSTGEPLS